MDLLSPFLVDALPEDALDAVLLLNSPRSTARLALTCRRLCDAVVILPFERRLGKAQEIAKASSPEAWVSLEMLAVEEAVSGLKSNHIVFHMGSTSLTSSSARLLRGYAKLLRRHHRLRIKVESHTGVGAPPQIAPQHSVQRGAVVAQALVARGVAAARIEVTGWGTVVGLANEWPGTQRFARAEVFVAFPEPQVATHSWDVPFPTKRCLPTFPDYYGSLLPTTARVDQAMFAEAEDPFSIMDGSDGGGGSDGSAGSDDSDGEGGGGSAVEGRRLLTPSRLFALLTSLGPRGVLTLSNGLQLTADADGNIELGGAASTFLAASERDS